MFEFEKEHVPEQYYEGESEQIYWVCTRGGFLLFLILAFHVLIFVVGSHLPASPIGARVHLLATSIFSSGILSFALIAVYWDVRSTQAEQTKILDNQQSVMEASHLPTIDPLNVQPATSGDELEITLENTGNGPAVSLSATIHCCPVDPGSGNYTMPSYPNQKNLYRSLIRAGSPGSTTLRADNTEDYTVEILIPDFNDNSTFLQVKDGLDKLVDKGIKQIDLQVVIRYEHHLPTKDTGYVYLKPMRADIEKGMSFQDLWNASSKWIGHPIDSIDGPEPFRNPGEYYGN